jgi:ABC-type lipoprotein export system ATPase subunit
MANDPAIILADEPTGALDSKTGRLVMDLFHKLNEQEGKTIILITHSNELARETDRIISIRDGNIESEEILKPEKYKDTDIEITNNSEETKEERPKKKKTRKSKNKEEK